MIRKTYNHSIEQENQIRNAAKRLGFWLKSDDSGLHVRAPDEFHRAVEIYLSREGGYADLSLVDIYNRLHEPSMPETASVT